MEYNIKFERMLTGMNKKDAWKYIKELNSDIEDYETLIEEDVELIEYIKQKFNI